MPVYAYKGVNAAGKNVRGVREADSAKGLRQILKKDGIVVTHVDVSKGGKAAKVHGTGLSREVKLSDLFARVKKSDLAVFTRQLATLLRAGIPLAEALAALFEQTENEKFRSVIGEVRTSVNEGSSFADALAKQESIFNDLFVSMVRAGELAGNLDEVLLRLADFLESSQRLRGKVQAAMIYPTIMVVVGTAIMAILMLAVVPQITAMFVQQNRPLPWNTRLLIAVSSLIGGYWWLLLLLVVAAGFGFRSFTAREKGRAMWHQFVLRMLLVGPLVRRVAIARFTRTLGTMLSAGVPMLRALDTSKEVLGNAILVEAVEKAKAAVTEGESLAVTMRKTGHFPATVTHMIAVGERAGQLEGMLARVADAYEAEVESKLSRLTTMLEPVMVVVMGVAIAFVVFSILMPIMDMGQLPT